MAETTPIEWTDRTWSPWEGCTKVSPGCDHCYAASMNNWLKRGENWGPGAPRLEFSDEHWEKITRWDRQAAKAGKRIKNFPSICDPFDNEVQFSRRLRFFELIASTTNIDWLLLTKRIGNARRMLNEVVDALSHGINTWDEMPWPDVWIGATVVNQEEADRDIPKLLATPARMKFLSVEPMLGPVDLEAACDKAESEVCAGSWNDMADPIRCAAALRHGSVRLLDWVICGGESGRQARPMHSAWPRLLRDQCDAAGVPFLFKQWGEWHESIESSKSCWVAADGRGTIQHGTEDETQAFLGNTGTQWRLAYRPGKKAAGRLLDGVLHDGFPAAPTT